MIGNSCFVIIMANSLPGGNVMKKKLLLLLIMLFVGTVFVACGGDKSEESEEQTTEVKNAEISKAVVQNANGETEEFTMKELADLAEENDLKFKKLYEGQPITVVGEVESVQEYSEDHNVMGMDGQIRTQGLDIYVELRLKEGWKIKLYESENQDKCVELSIGDRVSVKSQIWSEFAYVITLSDNNDYPTEITVIPEETFAPEATTEATTEKKKMKLFGKNWEEILTEYSWKADNIQDEYFRFLEDHKGYVLYQGRQFPMDSWTLEDDIVSFTLQNKTDDTVSQFKIMKKGGGYRLESLTDKMFTATGEKL